MSLPWRLLTFTRGLNRKQLKFSKGDTLVILSKLSPDWFKARDAQGETGLIPVKFVRVIGETPPTSPKCVRGVLLRTMLHRYGIRINRRLSFTCFAFNVPNW